MKRQNTISMTLGALLTLGLMTGAGEGPPPEEGQGPPPDHGPPPRQDDGNFGDRDAPGDRPRSGGDELREPREDADDDRKPHRWGPMSDEDVSSALEVVNELYPDLSERMLALQKEDPEKLRSTLEKRFPRVRFMVMLKGKDPEMYGLRVADIQLNREIDRLEQRLKQARDEDDRKAYKDFRKELEDVLAKHFDVRQDIRQREVAYLKDRVEKLEEELDQRDDDRKDLIEQRLKELAGEGWS